MISTTHCPQGVWQCIKRVPEPVAPTQCGGALQQFNCLPPPSSVVVYCNSSTAHCPQAAW